MLPSVGGAVAALAILFALSYIQFRHIALALLVVLAPLPALAIAPQDVWPIPYLCGYFVVNVLAAQVRTRVAERIPAPVYAWREALAELIWPPAMVCAVAALPLFTADWSAIRIAASTVASSALAAVLVPVIARPLPYGEEFIVRTNRLREWRERRLDLLTFVVQPRWGWSVSGIAIVFAVLAYFGVENANAAPPAPRFWVPLALVTLSAGVGFAATRNLRRTTSFVIVAALVALMGLWLSIMFPSHAPVPYLAEATSIALMPCLLMAARSAKFARDGDRPAVATLRSFEQDTVTILFFAGGAAVYFLATGAFAASALMLCGGLSALIMIPALTTMIYDLAPPRVSLDAYRIR